EFIVTMWNESTTVRLVEDIAASYESRLGHRLVDGPAGGLELAETLYLAPQALLCHDGAADPRFIYANAHAQQLWQRTWTEFIGLPSRLSAEADERSQRATMLARAQRDGYIDDYAGIRVAADGTRFGIKDVTIWTVTDQDGNRVGQAAWIP